MKRVYQSTEQKDGQLYALDGRAISDLLDVRRRGKLRTSQIRNIVERRPPVTHRMA